jgi:hypothetical protein
MTGKRKLTPEQQKVKDLYQLLWKNTFENKKCIFNHDTDPRLQLAMIFEHHFPFLRDPRTRSKDVIHKFNRNDYVTTNKRR